MAHNNGITVESLIRQLQAYPADAQLQFGSAGGLHFLRLKQRGDKIVQVEFNEQVYRDDTGRLIVDDFGNRR